jgi:hypothetical protein
MTVEISVFLFGKPAWEIEGFEGGQLDSELIALIRAKGKDLVQELDGVADILEKLLQNGWQGCGTLYDVCLSKDVSIGQARKELNELGLDPDLAFELDDDEEDEPAGESSAER